VTNAKHAHQNAGDPVDHQHPYDIPYHWAMGRFFQYVNRLAVDRVAPFLDGRTVVEMGCGDGYLTAQLSRHAKTVFAFDLNERAIAFAKLIVEEPNVTFSAGRAQDLVALSRANLDTKPDVVATFEVAEHLSPEELDAFLAGAREVLGAGGSLVLTTPNGARRPGHKLNPYHAHEFTTAELRGILSAAGFADVRIQGLYLQPPWPERLEHFADVAPFRRGFRWLARAGADRPDACRTLLATCRVA
jgi:2-polyprenyl-3-methyl-5-hydroxy-6-metoxy-1,4-benzoquinol methylase